MYQTFPTVKTTQKRKRKRKRKIKRRVGAGIYIAYVEAKAVLSYSRLLIDN
jgi:hypothetical protein